MPVMTTEKDAKKLYGDGALAEDADLNATQSTDTDAKETAQETDRDRAERHD